jgi:hypothetical protein
MSKSDSAGESHVYRVDKFVVPAAARQEFLGRVKQTHELLRRQAGFVRDLILEQASGPGAFNFVTLVEWQNEAALVHVRAAVGTFHKEIAFDPQELITRLGIKADIGVYARISER